MKKYDAAFMIPKNAEKHLGNNGWEFDSDKVLTEVALGFLEELGLVFYKKRLGISYYKNKIIQANVIYNDGEEIEGIFFQVSDNKMNEFIDNYRSFAKEKDFELFVPKVY